MTNLNKCSGIQWRSFMESVAFQGFPETDLDGFSDRFHGIVVTEKVTELDGFWRPMLVNFARFANLRFSDCTLLHWTLPCSSAHNAETRANQKTRKKWLHNAQDHCGQNEQQKPCGDVSWLGVRNSELLQEIRGFGLDTIRDENIT